MILYEYVKEYKYKKCDFYLRRGNFDDKPAKLPTAEKNYQNIHPQLIHMTLQESMIMKGI
jgi:hypothetical protein